MISDSTRKDFAGKLQYEMATHGLTQRALYQEYNSHHYEPSISLVMISRWCTGKTFPKGRILLNLCDLFDKPASYFLEAQDKAFDLGREKQTSKTEEVEPSPERYPVDSNYILAKEVHALTQAVQTLTKLLAQSQDLTC